MQNVKELRESLINVFYDLKSGEINTAEAKEMNNSAGKIIGTLKVQLEYADLRKEKPEIDFLDCTEKA